MRRKRILGNPGAAYHVISRFVDRQFALGDNAAKRAFMKIMRNQAAFSGVEILTYCLMGNHFHLLIRIPERTQLDEAEILRRLTHIWSPKRLRAFHQRLATLRETSAEAERLVELELERQRKRMYNLSEFVKDVKQRFSIWFNHKNERKGTLFEERFKSVLVESGRALRTIAAYIELNPVRAGIVDDPVDYPWCGYAQAVAGNRAQRHAIQAIMTDPRDQSPRRKRSWKEVGIQYRHWLFDRGRETHHRDGKIKKKGFSRADSIQAWESEGTIPAAKLARCKARYFTDSLVVGSREFLETFIHERRSELSPHDKPCPTSPATGGLCTLVRLRNSTIS